VATTPRTSSAPTETRPPAVRSVQSRSVPAKTRLFLYVQAAGRCEFDGCNQYLLEHHVTKDPGNFAEMSHIFAFSDGGPRADAPRHGEDKHALDNLVLLCPHCHKLIDDDPGRWTVDVVRDFKRAHEDRVLMLTETRSDRHTTAVVLRGRVAGQTVSIGLDEIQAAVSPRYLGKRDVHEIDLTPIPDSAAADFWSQAAHAVRSKMDRFYDTPFDSGVPRHVSVFALAPIPVLMVLGECLSDKVPTTLYQRHRDTDDWGWKHEDESVQFGGEMIQSGTNPMLVALLVSVSGVVVTDDLPPEIDHRYSVYSVAPGGVEPQPGILRTEETLNSFRSEYQRVIRRIVFDHPAATSVELFPAVPAPVAVAMGRDLLPKRDPILVVHDFNRSHGGFTKTLEMNQP